MLKLHLCLADILNTVQQTKNELMSKDLIFKRARNFYLSQDKVVFWLSTISFLLALNLLIFWAALLKNLPPQIPLFYSLPWGDKQLAAKEQLVILPALIFLVTLANIIFTWHFHPSQYFIKRVLGASSLLFALITTITVLKIFLIFV